MFRSARLLALGVACVLMAAGCGQSKYVPVSGVVMVNGEPYPHAVVSFQPIGSPENPTPGRGSSANTDEQGRFVLTSDGTVDGAVIGKHRVRIKSRLGEIPVPAPAESRGGSSDSTAPPTTAAKPVDPIPPEWYEGDGKEFEVPPGGTDQANFDIKSMP
jgi:hypothetical protein